ncbi:helix-turn-helix domain-containing protein [Aestuariibacter sp. AA17]|uniref:Helix-turn-helix domain-containing protein n=1 Tax=Fluctibacter corallii TaxID=2984329 RepID=A0ABT3ACY4_9ALTE|nr:helix-turn-helix domain-containing protein [Aestuariibacter sp. AA17]MCV2886530.1 helix-turn-helix domain-containing protein [Aestuariibacter sp. AA17]
MVSQIPNIPSFLDEQDDSIDSLIGDLSSLKELESKPETTFSIHQIIQHEFKKISLGMKKALTFDECVEYTGLSKDYLYKLTHARQIPHCKPNGKKIYFPREEIDNWLLSNRVMTEDEVQSFTKEKVDHLNRNLRSK